MKTRSTWMIRAGKTTITGLGALALMAFLTGCPPTEQPDHPVEPPLAPQEQPVQPPQ